jgi:hypothetical protein
MPRKKRTNPHLKRKYTDIKAYVANMSKSHKYRMDYIVAQAAFKFYLSTDAIYKILAMPDNPEQIKIDFDAR